MSRKFKLTIDGAEWKKVGFVHNLYAAPLARLGVVHRHRGKWVAEPLGRPSKWDCRSMSAAKAYVIDALAGKAGKG